MSKPDPPAPPDPRVTAQAQTASNRETATANAYLGNVNQNTPWGNVNFAQTGQGHDGTPTFTQTTTLSPNQQWLNAQNERNSGSLNDLAYSGINTAQGVLGEDYSSPRFNSSAATGGRLDIASALGNYGSDVEQRTFDLATRGLDKEFDRSEESLRSRLANSGINAGTEAFGSEMESFNEGKGAAFSNAMLGARAQGQSDRAQALGELTGERGTNLSEALQQYNLDDRAMFNERSRPLNEITALMSGAQLGYQPITPAAPNGSQMAGTDVAGIYQNNFANQMAGYQQQSANQNALMGGLASLGGAAMGAPWMFGVGK